MKVKNVIAPFLIVILLAGCVPETTEHDFEVAIEQGGAYEKEIEANSEKDDGSDSQDNKDNLADEKLKILSTYRVNAESDDFNNDLNAIVDKTHELGGYVSSNEVETENAELSSAHMESKLILRVPKQNVVEMVEGIKDIVHVKVKSLNSIDVTDKYYDINDKIKGLEMREKRLYELYGNASKIEEIIEIENELAKIESKKKEEVRSKAKIEDRVKFSSVEVNLKEVKQIRQNETENMTSSEKIAHTFKSTGSTVVTAVVEFIIFSMKSLPIVMLIAVGVLIYRRYIAKYVKKAIDAANEKDDKGL